MYMKILFFLGLLSIFCNLVMPQQVFVQRQGDMDVTYRKLTVQDIEILKALEGVYQEGQNYNVLIHGNGTGLKPPDLAGWQRILEQGYAIENVASKSPLRASIDHSTSQYFPPIGNQGSQGSCVSWATGYYTKTFQEAQDQGWNLTGTTWGGTWPGTLQNNQDKVMTPAFLYNQINEGVDNGSYYNDNVEVIYVAGICTWNNKPYNHNDDTSWPNEAAWRQAPLYRGASTISTMYVNTDAGINNLKSWLNGNNFGIISIDANKYSQLVLISGKGEVWTYDVNCVENRNHANTVIGYDDNFGPYTEESTSKYGAFKIANSWGKGPWSGGGDQDSDGMYWISYKAMRDRVQSCYTYTDKADYNPDKIAVFQITHDKRQECEITIGQGSSGSPTASKRFEDYIWRGGAVAFPGNVMALDITEFTERAGYFIKVLDRTTTSTTGTINSFKVEKYSGPYNPGSPSEVYNSDEAPKATQDGTSVVCNLATTADVFISVNDVSITEGNSGSTNVEFTVSLSDSSTSTITVDYATANNTATSGSDYTAKSGTLSFASGETSKTVSVAVLGDTMDEPNETFYLNLSNAVNAIISDSQGVATINDNDNAPAISINDNSITEGDSGSANVTLTVTLSNTSSSTVTVNYATANGSATSGSDYTATSGTLSFASGETSKTLNIAVLGDTMDEPNESCYVNLSNPTNATISDSQGIVTINDNDAAPAISITDNSLTEGNSGSTNVSLTVTLTNTSSSTVTVNYATANNTAISGSDYTEASGTLSFASGETSKTVTIAVLGDTMDESNETFYVNLSNATNATISDSQGVITINDNDTATLSINDTSITEGNTGSANVTLTITLSTTSSSNVTVDFATANNTASSGSDYTMTSGTLSFSSGETSKTLTVAVLGDTMDEPNETFYVNLSNAVNATISDSQGVVTITDNDNAPAISIADASLTEGNSGQTNVAVSVTLSNGSASTVTVNYATANNTATSGSDYTATSGTLSFASGETSKTINVAVLGDTMDEPDEAFYVNLSNATNATIADSQAVVGISDNDNAPTISIADNSIAEGNSGQTNATLTVTLSNTSSSTVTVSYATANSTATSGSDYTATSGTLSFASGESSKNITVPVLGDNLDEPDETFYVNLSNPSNATIADNQAVVTINDDDVPSLSITDASVTEKNSTCTVTLTVSFANASTSTVSVDYATADNTAKAGSDYTAKSGTLSFAPGTLSKTVTITILAGSMHESTEAFYVNLSNPVNATIADGQGVVTITDDDPIPSISIKDATITEADSGQTNVTATVTLSNTSSSTVTVNYATANNTATSGTDYTAASGTLSFASGETSKTITVAITGDLIDEANETFYINLSNATNATIADSQGVVTITDDDDTPAITINDTTVTEGDSGTINATLTVTMSNPSSSTVTVNYQTANGTATDSDYTAASGTLSFAPGETSKTITIAVKGDTVDEVNEVFYLNLSTPVHATISDSKGQVTITDNDPGPTISINDVVCQEGNSGSTSYAVFTISLSKASEQEVSVKYHTTDGTATTANKDYSAKSGTVVFTPGISTQTVSISILGDNVYEANENFTVDLDTPVNATISDAQGSCAIQNDDTGLDINPAAITVTEGNPARATATFTIVRSGITSHTTTVSYQTANGTAISGSDYQATSGTITFAPTETSKTVSVTVYGDSVDEPDEVFYLNLSNATNGTIGNSKGTATITDDDNPPDITISDVTVNEATGVNVNANFTIKLSRASSKTITVKYATADGTALVGKDYVAKSGTLTFAPGTTSKLVTVSVIGDGEPDENNETFSVNLTNAVNANITDAQGVCTIADNDTTLVISDASVTEGNPVRGEPDRAQLTMTVERKGVKNQTSTVKYTTANGTAIAGLDYEAQSGYLTFGPTVATQTINITVLGDNIYEPGNEYFYVKLSSATNAVIQVSQAKATITDDELKPDISIDDVTVTEKTGVNVNATFTVKLSRPSAQTISVKYKTEDVTTTAGQDYTSKSGTLTFTSGTTSKTLAVAILGDNVAEADETFKITLSSAVNANIIDTEGVCTIVNDDTDIEVSDITVTEGNTGTTNATFTVTRTGITTYNSTAQYKTSDGSAKAGSDYQASSGTVSFAAGSTQQTVAISIIGDTRREYPSENFYLNLSNATGARIKTGKAQCTITDNDAEPAITINDISVVEPDSGTTSAKFTVSLSALSNDTITVKYATADGTAIYPDDYSSKSGTLTFSPGVSSMTVTITVKGDLLTEPNETFYVNLSDATKASIGDSQGACTITKTLGDYDGDGKADMTVYHQESRIWYALKSEDKNQSFFEKSWDSHEVIPVPGDYDGDGKTDMAMWNKTTGEWLCVKSSDSSYIYKHWGTPESGEWIPVPGDYDGDGKTDIAVWNKNTGEWFCLKSSDSYNSCLYKIWGIQELVDFIPVPGDYDGDGKTDIAVWNKNAGEWFCLESSDSYNSCIYKIWGCGDDFVPTPADYDGDGQADIAVWQKSVKMWYCLLSSQKEPGYVCKVWKPESVESSFPVSCQQYITCDIYAAKQEHRQIGCERVNALQSGKELPGSMDDINAQRLPGTTGMNEMPSSFPGSLGNAETASQYPGSMGMEVYSK